MDISIIIALILIIFFIFLVSLFYLRDKKRFSQIISYFNGEYKIFDGVSFIYETKLFSLINIGTTNRNGFGGSYPVLKLKSELKSHFVIAKESARKYLYVSEFPKNHQLLTFDEFNIVIICDDEKLRTKLVQNVKDDFVNFKLLFDKNYAYLKYDSELIASFPKLIVKTYNLLYVGHEKDIYDTPEKLENSLKILVHFISSINL